MKNSWKILAGLILISGSLFIKGCVKGDFDEPPLFIPKVDFEANTTIAALKASYTGFKQIENDIIISGVVVANDESGNLFKKIIIQDATAGIELSLDRYNLYNEFKLGQRVFVKCKNMYIGDYNNLMQLGYDFNNAIGRLPDVFISSHVFRDSLPGNAPVPKVITLSSLPALTSDILARLDSNVSTLVRFENVRFAPGQVGQTFVATGQDYTTVNLLDASGKSLDVRTSSYASFANDLVPAGYGKVTGVLSVFRRVWQLTIRDAEDIQDFEDGPPPPTGDFVYPPAGLTPVTGIDEKFDNVVNDQNISLPGWTVQATEGTRFWRGRVFGSEKYAQSTAFNATDPVIKTWMITPPVIYDPEMNLSFKSSMAFYVHNGLSVWILYNYDGTNHEDAVWQQIEATLAGATSGDHTWIPSGEIDLSAILPAGYSGNFYIGFLYEGSPTNTTTYRIDDLLMGEGGGGGGGTGTGSGTKEDPFDVARAIERQNETPRVVGWVKGYIVGAVKAGISTINSSNDIDFTAPFSSATNVLLADNINETNYMNCIAVNLPSGTPLRAQVNLLDNPDNHKKLLNVTGTLRTYFGIAGSRDGTGTTAEFELEGNGGGTGTSIFLEEFNSDLSDFIAYSVTGDQVWGWGNYDGGCAVMSGYFNLNNYANEDWLISPAISLEGETGVTMNFREAINYLTSYNDLKVLVSTNYSGSGNPTGATWTELSGFNRPPGNNWTFVNSGDISLAAFESQTIYIAFKYLSTAAAGSTWEISRVEVK